MRIEGGKTWWKGGAAQVNKKMRTELLERKARRPTPGTKKTPQFHSESGKACKVPQHEP